MKSILGSAFIVACMPALVLADDQLIQQPSKDNSPQCQCYLTSGPDPGYFQYHRFWDFRNVPDDGDNDYTVAPPLVSDDQNNGDEVITSSYFNTSSFLNDWSIQTGQETNREAVVPIYYSAQNVYFSRNSSSGAENSTYLTLRTNRLESFMSIAELDSNQKNLLHSSIRVRARIIPNGLTNTSAPSSGVTSIDNEVAGSNASHPVDGGAVWGFFTYHSDEQESDIEVLTWDPTTQIHYSNQPDFNDKTGNTVPGASTQATLPDDLVWTEWIDHRIDWFDGIARWYVNDELVENKTKNAEVDHSGLIVNLWSDGGEWSGNMTVGGQVTVAIEWIDMVFNVSGQADGSGNHKRDGSSSGLRKRKDGACEVACNVDGIQTVGFPEVAYNASSNTGSCWRGNNHGVGWTYSMAMLTALLIVVVA